MTFISLYGEKDIKIKDFYEWIDRADFYQFPFIYYYDSYKHCQEMIENFKDVQYEERKKYIKENRESILEMWRSVLPSS